jgi:SET domain/PWWP domain/AWS domain
LALRKIASVAEENDVVWTKIRGHPYWPAQVVNLTPKVLEQKRFKDALRFRRRLDDTCVQYFGTLQIAWVQKAKTCISWASGVERGLHNVLQSRPVYVDAINEVASYCARLTKYPRGWWCEPPCIARACEFVDRFAPPSHPDFSRDAPVVPAAQKLWATARSEGIAWAKLRGFPHWPVQILPRDVAQSRYPELKLDRPASSTSPPESPAAGSVGNSGNLSSATVVPCMFFGTAEVACVPSRNMTDFEEGVAEGFVVGSDRYDFEIALGEVYGYLHTPREWPTGYGSGRLWWNAPEFRVDSAGNLRSPENSSVSDEELHPPPEIPKYEFIRRSVWPEGESPPPRTKRSEIPVCSCTPRPSGACSDCSCLNFMSRIICDPATCPAGEFCRNVSFHRRPKPALRPFFTADGRGWGLRTVKPIARGDFVVEYVGEIIDKEECERRLKSVQKSSDAEYYMMEINSDHVLDAHFKGNLSRFINSSCAPNCATQKWIDASTGQTRVGIFAIADIPGGAEVLYNYCFQDFGLASKKGKRAFTCRCGAPQCCMYEAGEYDRTQSVLGKRVKVRWDDGWYMGTVESYDPVSKDFLVHYDDGDDERLRLGENSRSGSDIAFKLVEDS